MLLGSTLQVLGEDNYDGPDMTYYFDDKEEPPSGPDDGPALHAIKARKHQQGAAYWSKQKGVF